VACGQTASGRAINFTIDSVPDSLVQQGVFADYFDSGALLSSLIKIDPGAAVTVEVLLQIVVLRIADYTLLVAESRNPGLR
jgi:preprotein translocase subunit Sec61beta